MKKSAVIVLGAFLILFGLIGLVPGLGNLGLVINILQVAAGVLILIYKPGISNRIGWILAAAFLIVNGLAEFLGFSFTGMDIVLAIVALVAGTKGLIVEKEEEGSLELILAQPVSRSEVFWSKLLALPVSIILILAITWGGFALGLARTDSFDLDQAQLIRPFVSLFAVLMVFLSLALMLSMILPTSGSAAMVANFMLIASFFITSLANIEDRLGPLNRFSPLNYYQGGKALSGLNTEYALILYGVSVVFIAVAWLLFEKRDLRFGDAGWLRVALRRSGRESA